MVGRVQDDVQPVTIGAMVREIDEALNETEGFRINYDGPMAEVVTYGTPLRQIILNLLSNSIKHHDRRDGEVTVELRVDRQRLFFTVKDDGPGIEKAYHERIFGLFQTLRSRDEVEGSGLGLAIIRKSVEFYGGTVRVESDPTVGRGASFIFDLPDMTDV
jgi:signal transduction histidine kinase